MRVPKLFLGGFNGDGEGHFVADLGRIFAHIEVAALKHGGGVRAARVLFKHRMRHALKRAQVQRNRLSDAFQREHAGYGDDFIAVEVDFIGDKSRRGIAGGIEKIRALYVFVKQGIAGVDRRGVDGDVDRACFRRIVDDDVAGGLVEATHLRSKAEVAVRKARVGMRAVDDVGFRCGQGRR